MVKESEKKISVCLFSAKTRHPSKFHGNPLSSFCVNAAD